MIFYYIAVRHSDGRRLPSLSQPGKGQNPAQG